MKTRQKQEKRIYSPIKQKVLSLLLAGAALGLNRSYKRQGYIIRELRREWKNIDHRYLLRIVREFKHDRLLRFEEKADGTILVTLNDKGKQRALCYNIDQLTIKKPTSWNGYWSIVLFDIPEKKRQIRDALRDKLRELGFHEWQKSVFIYPYPCRDEIDFIVEFFEARFYVCYAEMIKPTNEAELKLHFGL